jgi:hypothetical protein
MDNLALVPMDTPDFRNNTATDGKRQFQQKGLLASLRIPKWIFPLDWPGADR